MLLSTDVRVTPLAALAVAVFAASTSVILVRWSVASSPRSTASSLHPSRGPIAFRSHREAFGRRSRRDLDFAVLVGLAVHFATWFESLNHTGVAASVMLVQTQPIFVAVGATLPALGFLGEVPDAITLVGGLLVLAGIYATTRERDSQASGPVSFPPRSTSYMFSHTYSQNGSHPPAEGGMHGNAPGVGPTRGVASKSMEDLSAMFRYKPPRQKGLARPWYSQQRLSSVKFWNANQSLGSTVAALEVA